MYKVHKFVECERNLQNFVFPLIHMKKRRKRGKNAIYQILSTLSTQNRCFYGEYLVLNENVRFV